MRKSFVMMALLVLVASAAIAAPRTRAQMEQAARLAISNQHSTRHLAPSNIPLKVLRSAEQFEIIGTEENGFAVVAVDDLLPAVLGVSARPYSQGTNPNFEWWLQATASAAQQIVQSQMPLRVTIPDSDKFPVEILPMVTTKWYQQAPYNNMCPVYSGSVRCLTGCVATAMAQVLNYHQTPEHGFGKHTIYYGSQAVTADFEEDYYDWGHMRNIYVGGNYTEEEADAVALLMRDCGVAANMEYGGPNEGSGAYSQDAAEGLRQYFGFEDAECLERDHYSESTWMEIIYRELSENGPLYYGGASWADGGHAFVLDGYDANGMVSVNWGWAGDDDGFFYVSHLNPSGYDFNMGQDMIVGIKSNNHSWLRSEQVTMTKGGELREILEDTEAEGQIGTLVVTGPLNATDLVYLRYLAGWDENDEPTGGRLRILDLTKAKLENNTLPDSTFKNCAVLNRVRLPETIKAIGSGAFFGCQSLGELRVTTKSVPQLLGTGVFEGLPFGTAHLFVTNGLKTKYAQAAQWKDFGEKNIFQVGTSVKVRNAIRKYGEENPAFTFTVSGDAIEGKPRLTCEAQPNSPAGRYTVHISEGSVVNAEAVNFIDGYLVVQKVDATATVMTAERYEGDDDPEFKLSYSGLVAGDTAPVWVEEPVFFSSANKFSRPGEYAVFVKSATAESYNMVFLPGKLIVKEKPVPSGIDEVTADDGRQEPAYNLQGQRVTQQRKGISIVGGKKVLR